MAKQIKLAAQMRTALGRTAVKKIKQQGLVPAVVYGAKQDAESVQLSAREIATVLSRSTGEHVLVELEIAGGKNRLAIIQEVQHDPVKRNILHVDFHAVSADETIHAQIPLQTTGEAFGVKNYGGLLEVPLHQLEIECLPKDLPEIITIDITEMNLGDAVHVRDIKLPSGVVTHVDADLIAVRVSAPLVADPDAPAAASQPEVTKEKKADADKK